MTKMTMVLLRTSTETVISCQDHVYHGWHHSLDDLDDHEQENDDHGQDDDGHDPDNADPEQDDTVLDQMLTLNKMTQSLNKMTETLNKKTQSLTKYSQTQQTAAVPTPHRPHLQLPRSSKILDKSCQFVAILSFSFCRSFFS